MVHELSTRGPLDTLSLPLPVSSSGSRSVVAGAAALLYWLQFPFEKGKRRRRKVREKEKEEREEVREEEKEDFSLRSWMDPPLPVSQSPKNGMKASHSAAAVLDQEDLGESTSTEDAESEAFKRWVAADLVSPQQEEEFNAELAMREKKMRRFPVALSALYKEYSERVTVPIGHYNLTRETSYDCELAKKVATHHFIFGTGRVSLSADRMYRDFCSALRDVRSFSDHTAPTIGDIDLKLNMFRDGCFLLQYMRHMCISGLEDMPPSLAYYFDTNQAVINRDMMLLENQLPWVVIQTLRSYKEVPVEDFIAKMARTRRVRKGVEDNDGPFVLDSSYTPPHLLGLLWAYKVSKIGSKAVPSSNQNNRFSPFIEEKWFSLVNCCCCYSNSPSDVERRRPMSRTISAMELAGIGIKLIASKTTKFTDMGIKKGLFGCEIFLAPLLLDETNRCWLVNKAVFELYRASSDDTDKKHAIRPYLVILAMLMDREEDVHRLRSKGLINGALTNKEILDFFKGLVKHISGGPPLVHLMEEIEDYKLKRWMWIKVHKFFYRNYRTIFAVLSAVGVLVGIFKALLSLNQH